eukprot:8686693-Pyramimonas_sp.AAC.1
MATLEVSIARLSGSLNPPWSLWACMRTRLGGLPKAGGPGNSAHQRALAALGEEPRRARQERRGSGHGCASGRARKTQVLERREAWAETAASGIARSTTTGRWVPPL